MSRQPVPSAFSLPKPAFAVFHPFAFNEPIVNMPKRTDIHSILIIGAGPIIIGQACEFDYSGTQAC
jgi:hypothetical protein